MSIGLYELYDDFWHIDPPYSKTAQYLKHENASALSRFVSLVFTFLRCWQSLSVVSQVLSIIWSEICDLSSEIRDMCGKVTKEPFYPCLWGYFVPLTIYFKIKPGLSTKKKISFGVPNNFIFMYIYFLYSKFFCYDALKFRVIGPSQKFSLNMKK